MTTDSILKLIDKDLGTCYVTDKLEVFEKTFCGRVWAFFNHDRLNSDKVASAIQDLMATPGVLKGVSKTDKLKLETNLTKLATRFSMITKDPARANRSVTAVIHARQRIFDGVQTTCNPRQTAGAQRPRAESLSGLYPSNGDVVPVKPQPSKAPIVPQQRMAAEAPVSKNPILRVVAQGPQAGVVAALSSQVKTVVTTPDRYVPRLVDNKENIFYAPRGRLQVTEGATVVQETTDLGANLRAKRNQMGLK